MYRAQLKGGSQVAPYWTQCPLILAILLLIHERRCQNNVRLVQNITVDSSLIASLAGPDDGPERGERAAAHPPRQGGVDGPQGIITSLH